MKYLAIIGALLSTATCDQIPFSKYNSGATNAAWFEPTDECPDLEQDSQTQAFHDYYENADVQVRSHDHDKDDLKRRAQKAFELWDRNNDGFVDKCELAAYYLSQKVPLKRCVIQAKN